MVDGKSVNDYKFTSNSTHTTLKEKLVKIDIYYAFV